MSHLELLTRVALRSQALYIGTYAQPLTDNMPTSADATAFVARLAKYGYGVEEPLLRALARCPQQTLTTITDVIADVLGLQLNWMPLVRGWKVPTGESALDHVATFFANIVGGDAAGLPGQRLACGHFIPEGTFNLERYNGCPFCGRPLATANYVHTGQGSKLRMLHLLGDSDMLAELHDLLTNPTPLDATQQDSLQLLLQVYGMPNDVTEISMRETAIVAAKALVARGEDSRAGALLPSPTDILRYLWYVHTGLLKLIEPRTLMQHAARLNSHHHHPEDRSREAAAAKQAELRLSYKRADCRRVAIWLNNINMPAAQAAEQMHPKRGMWIQIIRALRLGEYSRRKGFDRLRQLLDVFYHSDYATWQGGVDYVRNIKDGEALLRKLSERPGSFARALFSTMLRVGAEPTLRAFSACARHLPARLLLSLENAASTWFDTDAERLARPLTGGTHRLPPHPMLALYTAEQRHEMSKAISKLFADEMRRRYEQLATDVNIRPKRVFIEPQLFNIPVAVGDRSTTIQDTDCALMGTRMPVQGDNIRLFMQWGKGLHAQHLDMDLSCRIAKTDGSVEECAYYNLTATGAMHSGDIRAVPEMVGAAEYVELSLPELRRGGARYVTFTCNAYSRGKVQPGLVVGWMDSRYPMTVSDQDGVAYDPSCVQHQVRVSEGNLSKGLVFGVLDVARGEIVWLEMPFTGQTLQQLDSRQVESLLRRLSEKVSVGQLLQMRAEATKARLVSIPEEADETYTLEWAMQPARVAAALL